MTWVRQTETVAALEVQQGRLKLFVVALLAFLCALPVLFWSVGPISPRDCFVLGFVWLLVTSEVFAPAEPETVWWQRLRWIKAAGWLVLVYIVARRVTVVI